jgi:hypothetical protein
MNDFIKELMRIKPMLPGTLEKRYNVCGKAGCICKDKINPKKHGPYYRLSFSLKGKNSSIFVKEKEANLVRQMTEEYKKQRNAPIKLGLEFANLCKEIGFEDANQEFIDSLREIKGDLLDVKSNSRQLKEYEKSKETWKLKAIERRKDLDDKNVKINDLLSSRSNWKEKYQQEKTEKTIAKQEISILQKQLKEQEVLISEQDKKNS